MQTPFQIDLQTISDVYPNAVKFNQSTNEFHIIVEIDLQQPMKLLLEEDDLIQTAYEGLNETTVDYLPAIEISIQEPTDFVTFDELHFKLSCVWITENQTQEVLQFMQDMYDDMNGEGYLFAWYSYLSNTIDNLGIEEIHITEMEYIDHPKIFSFIGNSLHRQRALIQHHLDTKKTVIL
ncbi:RWD domain-containing protein [Entamoeba marina]